MAVTDLHSKQQKRKNGDVPDVFTYDILSQPLRTQIVHIWRDALGQMLGHGRSDIWPGENPAYQELHQRLAREYGVFSLQSAPFQRQNADQAVISYFLSAETEKALDIIQLSFQIIISYDENAQWNSPGKLAEWQRKFQVQGSAISAVKELNQRFLEHGVGYAFVSGQLIRKDEELLHQEIVLPALQLLHEPEFKGANEEYLNAHEHYRHGRYKDCLNECLKAFESTIKTICQKRGWTYNETDLAKKLIAACLNNQLLPPFTESHLASIRSLLENGIPPIRNKLSGHGQGAEPKNVPSFYAAYLLHETATTIVFLVDAYQDLS